jgi:asparagine synthase (glutamine-hydrolysing)
MPRLGIRSLIKSKLGKGTLPYRYTHPAWLNPKLEKRLDLRGRWDRLHPPPPVAHIRSEVRRELEAPNWPAYFEILDPGSTEFPLEHRFPFFDLRVATFLAGLPALPWCQEKNILRAAGSGMLPDSVRLRPKTPLPCSPILEILRGCGPEWWVRHLNPAPELARYVDLDALPRKAASQVERSGLRPVSLNYWLQLGRKTRKIAVKQGRV